MKHALFAIAALCAMATAQAQTTNGANAAQSATGTGMATIAPGAVTVQSFGAAQLPWTATSVDSDIRTNQAMPAPPVYGSAAPSAGGCPVVDGWSASVVIANGGKSTAQELPGCMLNLLTDRLASLSVTKNAAGEQVFTGMSVMKLEAWCLYPLYRTAIENSGVYKCKATRDEEAGRARAAAAAPTLLPKPYTAGG